MKRNRFFPVKLDDQGRLVLPADFLRNLGHKPGDGLELSERSGSLVLTPSIHLLSRLYLEPTNECNLCCSTCMRNVWRESPGYMSWDTFQRFLSGIKAFSPLPNVFIGGYGEPLGHPRILDMISALKSSSLSVEIITNGTLLGESVLKDLVNIGLDRLWVSLDGSNPGSYADVRLGDRLPEIISNLRHLHELKLRGSHETPRLGIAFVAMKRNIADLPDVLRLGHSLGADRFSISNVLAHTPTLASEILYQRCMNLGELLPDPAEPHISLPRMDISPLTLDVLGRILRGSYTIDLARQELGEVASICPFLEKRSTSVRWDGAVSPCLALMYNHTSYLDDRLRESRAFHVGNINEKDLRDIWMSEPYQELRQRLSKFDFSPCSYCNSCDYAGSNQEDCFGNLLPACGGCLWSQGLIQCP